nr:retrovirus-related Pol polyprotein from transposon TNT 1-94 [Tanacetum cinerariifolium]
MPAGCWALAHGFVGVSDMVLFWWVLVTKPHNKTPYELLLGISPSIRFMRPFGCPVTILNTLDPLGKFDRKADEGFLRGYSVNSKTFRVLNSRTRIVQETLHINFLANKPNVVGISPKWLFNIDTLTKSMNYQPVVVGNQPNENAGIKENFDAGKVGKETVSAQQYVMLPLCGSDKTDNKKHDDNAKRDDKGKSPVDSPTGVRDLRAEFEEFSFNSTNRVNAVSAPVNAVRPNSTNNTNSFNTASPSNTAISPNFGITRKSSFVDPSKYLDDPDMPELEDIVYSDDEDDVGTEADLSNLETNISVSPIPTTRVHKDHPITQIIDLPKGKRAIRSKWVFRNKKDERGILIRNKSRLVVVLEDVIRRDLHLDDVDGVKCLPNEEIFAELARMGYDKPLPKLNFYKACSMASAVICLVTGRKFNFSKYIFDSMVRNVDCPSKFLMYLCFLQVVMDNQVADLTSHNTTYTSPALTQKVFANMRKVRKEEVKVPNAPAPPSPINAPSPPPQDPTPTPYAIPHASPPQEQPSSPHDSTIPLLNTLMETCASLSQKEDASKQRGKIEAIDTDKDITLVDVETQEEVVTMDAEPQGRIT